MIEFGEFEEKGVTKENLSRFCKEERFYFNGLLKLVQGKSNGRGFIAKKIWENVQEKMATYRDRIIETEEVINDTKEGENVFEKLKAYTRRENNEEITFFSVDPEIMEDCSESDKKSWGESRVFGDTRMALMITAMKKGIGVFASILGKDRLMLDAPSEEFNDSNNSEQGSGKKSKPAKTFDEEIKVDLSNEENANFESRSEKNTNTKEER